MNSSVAVPRNYRSVVYGILLIGFGICHPAVAQRPHHVVVRSDNQTAIRRSLPDEFATPRKDSRPQTWFHLIGGNVNQNALTKDLEAVSAAGIGGIQLFHGRGRAWPGVTPQIQTLSETWDSLISHAADQSQRLGLKFTMQNCPGWAMSGGPWITPENAMRHLVYSRTDVVGGEPLSIKLAKPQPSEQDWRDYRDIAVLAFPTPDGDTGRPLIPSSITSSLPDADWSGLLRGDDIKIQIPAESSPAWVDFYFDQPVTLRSIQLPPTEFLMKRMMFDPNSSISVSVMQGAAWNPLITHRVPRGNWQDRQPERHYVLAVPDATAKRYRLTFQNFRAMEISHLKPSAAARVHDWQAQAGYALRSLERTAPPRQSPAAWIRSKDVVDVTAMMNLAGRLNWDAPEGNWTVVRFGHVNTGVTNKPAPPEATGFECDKLSTDGADQHFAGYIGRLSKPGGAADNGRLQGMLIDSWECYTQTWTPAMENEFQKRRGYALRTWLPALAGWVVEDHTTSERFLRDWRATISDLIVENYYGRMAELGKQRGMELSFETAVGDVSPGDILQYFKSADIPMCEVWKPNDPHVGGLETKPIAPTTSAAHIYGKPRVAAETFTSAPMNWREHPFSLKNVADRTFAAGVTHLVFHTYTHNPLDRVPGTSFGNTIGTPFLRGQTWWHHMPHFTGYLARCQSMLEQGHPVADVLWYLGDDIDHKPRQDSPFPEGYHFDYVNQDVLLSRLGVDDGDLVIPEGTRWRVLWLAPEQCRRLTPQTLQRVKELLHAGATVIGPAPDMNPSLSGGNEANADFKRLVDELWGNGTAIEGDRKIGQGRLLWGESLPQSLQRLGIAPDVRGTLSERWCHRRVDDVDIYFLAGCRTQAVDATLEFRATGKPEFWNPIDGNRKPAPVYQRTDSGTAIPIRLPAAGSTFVVFRPETSSRVPIERVSRNSEALLDATDTARVDNTPRYPAFGIDRYGITQPWVPPQPPTIEFDCTAESLIAYQNGTYQIDRTDGSTESVSVGDADSISLDGRWELRFPDGWETPKQISLQGSQPWSEMDDVTVRHFSGTATYRTTFTLDVKRAGQRLQLDLGRVGNLAAIQVNGMDVGTLWSAPYRIDVTDHVKPGENTLLIAVTNTWHNRLAYDAGLRPEERKTWTIGPPPNDSPLEFSGLSSDVRLNVGQVIPISKTRTPQANFQHRPSELVRSSVVDKAALTFAFGPATKFGNTVNGRTHQQDALLSYRGYQYAAYVDANRQICLGRRKLPSGSWDAIRFTDHRFESNDSHNTAVIGICAADGTIHLAFDHHATPLNYRVSQLGVAHRPEAVSWDASLFGPVMHSLGSVATHERVTYPRFFSAPNGNLMFYYRSVTSADGDGMIEEYDGQNHDWTPGLGKFIAREIGTFERGGQKSLSRCPYINALSFAGQRLHVSWVWRDRFERTDARNQHDLCYAYSDDFGRTWHNSEGAVIGRTGQDFMHLNSPGLVVARIPTDYGLSNQNTHYAYPDGSIHIVLRHQLDGGTCENRYFHYWRDRSGKWSHEALPFVGRRPKLLGTQDRELVLAYSDEGELFLAKGIPDLGRTSWDWHALQFPNRMSAFGDAVVDLSQWNQNQTLSIYHQEEPAAFIETKAADVVDGSPSMLKVSEIVWDRLPMER
ncbi:glycosyl hydrolase [Rhodopirellula sp. JC639]|uniref:glycosyl hydrolase n=1 Tax=Stieleria mannarensis TaxID=2755585 RepID=UPI001603D4B2|nr:glycosyl hydrolase [Rhodopirellula sp. JC639]